MNKVIISTFMLIATIVIACILYGLVFNYHPNWGEFWNLFYMGLVAFFMCVGIFASGLLLERSVKSMQD